MDLHMDTAQLFSGFAYLIICWVFASLLFKTVPPAAFSIEQVQFSVLYHSLVLGRCRCAVEGQVSLY